MDVRVQTSFIAALLTLALASSVLLRARTRRTHWLFGIFGLVVATWYASNFMRRVIDDAPVWERINLACGVLLPLAAVRFFGAFVGEDNRRMRLLNRSALIGAAAILAAIMTPLYQHPVVGTCLFVYVTIFVFAALFMLYASGQAATSRPEGARLKYMAIVGGLGGFFTLFDYLPYVGLDMPPVGTILILIFLYVLSQSITRYRLLDLYELAGRLGVLTALAFMLSAMLWLLAVVSQGRFFVHGVVSALVILVLFDPVRARVEEWISQLFFHERFEFEQTIQHLRRTLAHTLNPENLASIIMDELANSPRLTHAALYLMGPHRRTLLLKGSVGPTRSERIQLAPARPLLDHLTRTGAVVLENAERELEDLRQRGEDREAETMHDIVETLRALEASVCLAIKGDDNELYGLLVVQDARVRDAFSPEEVQLLAGLATQAAVALENSALYEQMKAHDRLAALGEMAAGLAHEIRNPLGAIKASAQYLTDPELEAKDQREFLDIIVDEVDRLNRVVSSFLDYARPPQGDPAPNQIESAIRRTVQLLRSECESNDITLELSLQEQLPPVKIDVEQLRQVLLNLVRNALQAIEKSGRIHVSTSIRSRARAAEQWVEIRVEDTGPGVRADVLPNLFVPFVTTKQKGTGLGLAISQRIVNAAGGRIEVRSRPGQGTAAIVLLPAYSEPQEREHAPQSEEAGGEDASEVGAALPASAGGALVASGTITKR